MITLPRPLVQQLRALLHRSLPAAGPRDPPMIRLHTGPDGLEMAVRQHEAALVYRQPEPLPPESLNFPADVLADIEGKDGLVTLSTVAAGKGEARWEDGGVSRRRQLNTVVSEDLPELPKAPSHLQPVGPAFLHALAEAARTAARETVRFALSRIQLRGKMGQVVATDGRQLLVQSGFSLPWEEDVLIPALPLFASRDLPREGPLAIGRTASHVSLRMGPWLLHLEIDASGRYPDAQLCGCSHKWA